MEFQRWWVLKSKIFAQESICSKDSSLNSADEWRIFEKEQTRTLKVDFYVKTCRNDFEQKKIIKRYQFRRPFKTLFCSFNFWTTIFSKIMLNFWRTGAPRILKIQWFPLSILNFDQRPCFLWPTIFEIPQLN